MTELTKAVALSGALDQEMIRELNKWKLPIDIPDADLYDSPEEAIAAIEEAITGESQVEVRVSDLDVLKQYLHTKRKGKLHLVTQHESGTFDCTFGMTVMGEYILPWRESSLEDHLTNGESYLLDDKKKVYISDVRDIYFGETKAFILCTPQELHGKLNKG